MTAYYRLRKRSKSGNGDVSAAYEPLTATQGAWNPHEQHMAPATGILCAELEAYSPRPGLRIGRISLDIWGLISLEPFTIETRLLRGGRTIELIEARMLVDDRTLISARAWRMQTCDTSQIQGIEDSAIAHYDSMQPWDGMKQWGGGFINSMQFKANPQQRRAGNGVVWMTNSMDMIEGQRTSSFVKLMGMADTSNGIVPRANPREWIFPNLDLNISLLRMPQGQWLGLDTRQQYGSDGIGLTSSVLHDEQGVFAHSLQTLTLRSAQR